MLAIATKKGLQRGVGGVPTPRGKDGNADLYARRDVAGWAGDDAR